jgi:hypothetical protein
MTKIVAPLYDAQDKAMRISYAYSQNTHSAAELVQGMIDGAVQDRCAPLLEALEYLIDSAPLQEWAKEHGYRCDADKNARAVIAAYRTV